VNESINTGPAWGDVAAAKAAVEEAAGRVQTARRDFLKLFGYGSAGLMLGGLSIGKDGLPGLIPEAQAGAYNKSPYENAFGLAAGLLYMNIGTTGSSPTQVVKDSHLDTRTSRPTRPPISSASR
jgi:hypothetical protein